MGDGLMESINRPAPDTPARVDALNAEALRLRQADTRAALALAEEAAASALRID